MTVRRPPLARDLLAVDVGNSKVQALLVLDGAECLRWRVDYGTRTRPWQRDFAIAAAVARRESGARLPIVVASVAPARAATCDTILRRLWRLRPHHVDWRDPWPYRLDIRQAHTLGADRLANVAGLRALGLTSGIAIDAGTAITVDVLARGRFVGGLILPGSTLMAQALHAHTAQLPVVRVHGRVPLVGDATASALQAGIFHGLVNALRGIARALQVQLGVKAVIVLTGGQGDLLAPALPRALHEPDLLLLGLRHLQACRTRRAARNR